LHAERQVPKTPPARSVCRLGWLGGCALVRLPPGELAGAQVGDSGWAGGGGCCARAQTCGTLNGVEGESIRPVRS
jgi:hypothetical protein